MVWLNPPLIASCRVVGVGKVLLAQRAGKPVPKMAWQRFDVDEGESGL